MISCNCINLNVLKRLCMRMARESTVDYDNGGMVHDRCNNVQYHYPCRNLNNSSG